jgi:hypothetical protein
MAKKVDALKAKQKRQKTIAIVGGVILLALVAFQVPRVMKQLNKKPPVSSASVSTTTAAPPSGAPSLAAPTLGGTSTSTVASAPSSGDGVTAGDAPPSLQDGQLASFSRFASKDPFAQQLSDANATASGAAAPTGGLRSAGGSSTPSGGSPVPTSSGGSPPAPGSAVISVNGTLTAVTVGTDFPAASATDPTVQPLFHLVSLSAHAAKISIVGGSYSNGAATVTLRENKPLTLMNTADGTRYKLILKPQGTPIQSAAPAPTTTPTSTTPAP